MANEDERLIRQTLDGFPQAFGKLMQRYGDRVYAMVAGVLGDCEEAQEAVQDAFLRAFRGLKSFEGRSDFATWLYRIAYNCAMTHAHRHRLQTVSLNEQAFLNGMQDGIADEEVGALFESGDEQRLQLLEEALDALPPPDLALINLYYYDDLPIRNIAYIVGQSESNVRTRLHRIRKRLYLYISEQLKLKNTK